MGNRVIAFVFFAAAMLFSITREWSAPIACPRLTVNRQISRR